MIKIGKHGILKRDIISVYFDNEDYEITVYLNKEKHSNSCDGFNHIECDLGQWQRIDLNNKLYDSVIEMFNKN